MAKASARSRARPGKVGAAAAPRKGLIIYDQFPQDSDEWREVKLGVPSASNFADIMADGDGLSRAAYMRQLAGEIVTGIPAETYESAEMKRGKAMEPMALEDYRRTSMEEVRLIAFAKNEGLMRYAVAGASPDALVGDDGGLEIKTEKPELMIQTLERGTPPAKHIAQVQGNMWVLERRWWHLKIFYPGMPRCQFRIERNDQYIAELQRRVEVFCYDLKKLVEKLRGMDIPR